MKLRTSCVRCNKLKRKCDLKQPSCTLCSNKGVVCDYKTSFNRNLYKISYQKDAKGINGKDMVKLNKKVENLETTFSKLVNTQEFKNYLVKNTTLEECDIKSIIDYQINLKRDAKFLEHRAFYRHLVTLYYNFQYGITSMVSRNMIEAHFNDSPSESILLNSIYATTLPLANFISNKPSLNLLNNPFYKKTKLSLLKYVSNPDLAIVHTYLLLTILEIGMGCFNEAMKSISYAVSLGEVLAFNNEKQKRENRNLYRIYNIEEPTPEETAWSLCIIVDHMLCCNMRQTPHINFKSSPPKPLIKGYPKINPDVFINNHEYITHGKIEAYLLLTDILYNMYQLDTNCESSSNINHLLYNLKLGKQLLDKLNEFGTTHWLIRDTSRKPNLTFIDDYFITRIDVTLFFHCVHLQVNNFIYKLVTRVAPNHYIQNTHSNSEAQTYSSNAIASAEWIVHFVKVVELTCSSSYKPIENKGVSKSIKFNNDFYKGIYYISLCFAMGLNHAKCTFLNFNYDMNKVKYCENRLNTLKNIWPIVEMFNMPNPEQSLPSPVSLSESSSSI